MGSLVYSMVYGTHSDFFPRFVPQRKPFLLSRVNKAGIRMNVLFARLAGGVTGTYLTRRL